MRQYEALQAALAKCRDELGPVDVLVCGAAGNFPIPAEKLSPNGFKSVVDIDLLGSFNACRAAFEQLSATRGCIIFISAGMSFVPYPYQVHVGAAKAGIDNMMKNLALEWGKYGIRSNSIVPGSDRGHRRRDAGWAARACGACARRRSRSGASARSTTSVRPRCSSPRRWRPT